MRNTDEDGAVMNKTTDNKLKQNSANPDAGYPDRQLSGTAWPPSDKSVGNSIKLTCLEITGHRIKYSTVLRLLELQIRRGRKF